MIKEVKGNLLTYPGLELIGHQTNCLGVMGGGIAKQIKNKNPRVYDSYYCYCKLPKDPHSILGTLQCVRNDNDTQWIANIFGEYSFCESIAPYEENGKPRHTDYDALQKALSELHNWINVNNIKTAGIPHKLGCGLAGGDWDNVVYPMIINEFKNDLTITLYIVKFN